MPGKAFRSAALGKLALVALGLVAAAAVRAEVADIAWSEGGRFEREVSVPAGKFAEFCGRLGRADAVAWRFDAGSALDFNIHYHEGKDVRFPARHDATTASRGTLRVALDQTYCWMWTNRSERAVKLRVELLR